MTKIDLNGLLQFASKKFLQNILIRAEINFTESEAEIAQMKEAIKNNPKVSFEIVINSEQGKKII